MAYFDERDATPRDILEVVLELKRKGLMPEVEAALRSYLNQGRFVREPWMYEMLAVALDYNRADESHIRQALGYAAYIAGLPGDRGTPGSLVTIAELMAARGFDEVTINVPEDGRRVSRLIRLGDLLDDAAERLPNRAEPRIRSIELAERQGDAERMSRAIEGLFALGWPGTDEAWRSEARLRVTSLARRLRAEGRASDAEAMLDRLDKADQRDLYARLTWDGFGDLDLLVDEPLGATARVATPRTVFGGALVKNGRGSDAEEVYTCPKGFDGTYTFRVDLVVEDPDDPITAATLEVIAHEGTDAEDVRTFAIDPKAPEPFTIKLANRYRQFQRSDRRI